MNTKKLVSQRKTFYTFNNKVAYISAIVGIIVAVIACGLSAAYTFIYQYDNKPMNILWNFFQYFTIQTNILVLIFFALFWINQWKPFIKTSAFQNIAIAYITVTFVVYAALLLPGDIKNPPYDNPLLLNGPAAFYWAQNIAVHFVCPITAIVFLFSQFSTTKLGTATKPAFPYVDFWKYALVSMVYPTLYVAYVIIVNFVKIDGDFHSVYGQLSNFNKDFAVTLNDGTSKLGSLWHLLIVGGVWLFFCIAAWGNYWIDRKFYFHKIYHRYHRTSTKK